MPDPTHPSGTVTFLFPDVEGSTQLWEQHPAWMAGAHARHEAILRDAIAAQDGWALQGAYPTFLHLSAM